jgi:Predicted transcriptional regulators containing the CopG/Arc/MetJ DNA-binding domain and a metal-binding domain
MSELSRFGVSVEEDLLQNFDQLIAAQGYGTRSEALRDLMRDAIVKSKVEGASEDDEGVGSLTLIYDHHARDLTSKMNDLQHDHHNLIVSVMHIHISHDDCMEVIALRGKIKSIRSLAESLLSIKGVKHGELFVTLPAKKITEKKANSGGGGHRH